MKKFITYSAGLIALYLIVYNGSNSGQLITKGANGATSLVRAFQGRK